MHVSPRTIALVVLCAAASVTVGTSELLARGGGGGGGGGGRGAGGTPGAKGGAPGAGASKAGSKAKDALAKGPAGYLERLLHEKAEEGRPDFVGAAAAEARTAGEASERWDTLCRDLDGLASSGRR